LNLIGEEVFASQIVCTTLLRPFKELFVNNNMPSYYIQEELNKKGYPYSFNLREKQLVNSLSNGLLDSAKTVRGILWNSISIIMTIITSD
jgi:chaperonin GroEL (HSP60 family)